MTVKVETWKVRAITHCRGNQTKLGCIIICMLGYLPKNPPRMQGTCVITAEGRILADVELLNGRGFLATDIGPVEEIRDDLRRLADNLKFSDAERVALFTEMQKWVLRDYRATSTLQ